MKGQSPHSLLCGLILTACLLTSGQAQTTNQPANQQEPALKIKTELLQLSAVVTDKQGKVIEGLQATEFELLENNRPQKIEFFGRETIRTAVSKEQPGAAGAKTPAATPLTPSAKPTRTIALFVDNVHLTLDSLDRTKQTLRRFVNEQMTENDLVCIVTAAGSIGIVNQFTQDRQLLLRAIEKLTLWRINDNNTLLSPYLAARIALNNSEAVATGMMLLEAEDASNKGMPTRVLEMEVRARSFMLLAEASNQRRVMLSTLKALTERLAELPGQRLLFFFSDGFSLAGIGGGFDSDDLTPTISRALRAGVILYTFGAQGLTVQMLSASQTGIVEGGRQYTLSNQPGRPGSGAPITVPPVQSYLSARNNDQKIGMNTLALDTGGKPFFETNDLNGRITQALEENRVYYTLSYYPEDFNNPNKARKLTVRVKGHPEYEVRTQRSYVPAELLRAENDIANLTPRQRLARAMISPLPVNALGISVAADYFEREGDANQVLLQTYIESDKLDYQQQDGAYDFHLEVATAIYDGAGKLINGWSDEIKGGFKAERFEAAKNAGFRQFKWLSLKPGLYQIRVGIMEAKTERLGTAMAWVEVPKLGQNKALVSNLMLMQQADAQADGTKSGSLSHFRQGIRLYQRGEVLAYFLRVYPSNNQKPADAEITIQTQIAQGDRLVFQSQWLPVSARTVAKDKISREISGELKLNTIKPGLYELRVLVKEPKSNQPLQRAVLFSVEP